MYHCSPHHSEQQLYRSRQYLKRSGWQYLKRVTIEQPPIMSASGCSKCHGFICADRSGSNCLKRRLRVWRDRDRNIFARPCTPVGIRHRHRVCPGRCNNSSARCISVAPMIFRILFLRYRAVLSPSQIACAEAAMSGCGALSGLTSRYVHVLPEQPELFVTCTEYCPLVCARIVGVVSPVDHL